MSELQFMRIVCWAVMRASLAHVARTRSNERCTRVVRSVIWWDVIGRLMSSHVGSSRYKSGQSGRYFFLAFYCCYVFASVLPHLESVPGSGKFTTTYADARLTPVTWRLEWQSVVSGQLMSGQVDPSRSRSIQVVWFSFFLAIVWLGLRAFARCLCWVMGSSQACKGPSLASRFPAQRESWLHDDEDTLSAMPIHISAPGYCVTVLNAIALCQWCDGPRKGKRI